MSDIGFSQGRAKEYCECYLNLYLGCNHGCLYCYVPEWTKTERKAFLNVRPTKDTIKSITKSAKKYQGKEVLLCFLTDPYNSIDMDLQLTRHALEIFRENGVIPVILTKAGMKSTRDFDLLTERGKYGATLTFIKPEDSLKWEPGASLPEERMRALREAKDKGIETWVSLEPVIDPVQTVELIHKTHEYIDEYKVGKWNHDRRAESINWRVFLRDVKEALGRYQKSHYIKTDLRNAGA